MLSAVLRTDSAYSFFKRFEKHLRSSDSRRDFNAHGTFFILGDMGRFSWCGKCKKRSLSVRRVAPIASNENEGIAGCHSLVPVGPPIGAAVLASEQGNVFSV